MSVGGVVGDEVIRVGVVRVGLLGVGFWVAGCGVVECGNAGSGSRGGSWGLSWECRGWCAGNVIVVVRGAESVSAGVGCFRWGC